MSSSTQTIAVRVQELRRRRGWSAANLAQVCTDLGMPELNRSVIANIECGRREYVSTDELLVLASAFDVAPIHLMVPIEGDDEYHVTPNRTLPLPAARAWIRGESPPPGRDPRPYFAEVPREEYGRPATGLDVPGTDELTR